MKDYYKILGIDKKSTKSDIKKAYRTLSKKYHPDVNPDGAEKFKEIAEAYETLIDDNKRQQYDNPSPFRGGGFNPFDDIFQQFRGGQNRRTKDTVINLEISPIESFIGCQKEISYMVKNSCNTCYGSGGSGKTCEGCGGTGKHIRRMGSGFFTQVIENVCNQCNGTGKIIVEKCVECNGATFNQKEQKISINIPKNINTNQQLS